MKTKKIRKAVEIEPDDKRQLNVRITNHAFDVYSKAANTRGISIAALLEIIARGVERTLADVFTPPSTENTK